MHEEKQVRDNALISTYCFLMGAVYAAPHASQWLGSAMSLICATAGFYMLFKKEAK